jgi:hypothetical protein
MLMIPVMQWVSEEKSYCIRRKKSLYQLIQRRYTIYVLLRY